MACCSGQPGRRQRHAARAAAPSFDLPKVLVLVKRLSAVIEVNGVCTLSQEPYPFQDIWDPIARGQRLRDGV
jgi:hypothetical protein